MENANKQICRLCLELILDGDCEVIEESKKEILDILLIKIDFDISNDAVACKTCLGKLQDCFDFKSICVYVDDCITPFVDADIKLDIKNVVKKVTMTSENVILEDSRICRLCMSFIKDEAFNYYTSDLKDMIRNCLPEVNLNSVDEPLVCKPCLSNMIRYYEFMKSCEEVEQKIKNYIQQGEDHGIASKVILEDVLELKNNDTLSKPIRRQWLDVENETECIKSEEVNIKCEEIEIKDELDIGGEVSEALKSENDNSSENNGSLKERKVGKSNTKGKILCCPKCPYSANTRYNLKTHMRSHSNNEVCTCTLCSFVTDSRLLLKAHLAKVHRGTTKVYGCHECPYETDNKSRLQEHLLKHKDKSEVEMYKCLLCSYESKYKSALSQHQKLEHGKNIRMYQCAKCQFSTKYKKSLVEHQLLHKNPEEILKHKCAMCEFQTSYKMNLVKQMLRHEKRQRELVKHMMTHPNKCSFSCYQCTYSSKYKPDLQRHKHVHQKDGIREMYKCNLCDYRAKTRVSIKNHMIKIHTDSSKVPTFKCALCPYESIFKRYLPRHMTRCHKRQPTFKCTLCLYVTNEEQHLKSHSLIHKPTIKCDHCDFHTKHTKSLKQHMKLHESVKSPRFKCDICEYNTSQKGNFNRHKVTHMELGESIAYKCAMCDFRTKYKSNLKGHIKRCLKKKNVKNEKK